jgi:hypothetical protein
MENLLAVHFAVMSNRTLVRSGLPYTPTVSTRPRLPRERVRRSTAWRLRRIADRLAPAWPRT